MYLKQFSDHMANVANVELNESSEKAKQPFPKHIKLKCHQLTSLNRMILIENGSYTCNVPIEESHSENCRNYIERYNAMFDGMSRYNVFTNWICCIRRTSKISYDIILNKYNIRNTRFISIVSMLWKRISVKESRIFDNISKLQTREEMRSRLANIVLDGCGNIVDKTPVTEARSLVTEAMSDTTTSIPALVTEAVSDTTTSIPALVTEAVSDTTTSIPALITEAISPDPVPITAVPSSESESESDSEKSSSCEEDIQNDNMVVKISTTQGILGDIVGYGKTYTALGLIKHSDNIHKKSSADKHLLYNLGPRTFITGEVKIVYKNQTLIVCPNNLLTHWKNHVEAVKMRYIIVNSENILKITDILKRHNTYIVLCPASKYNDLIHTNNVTWGRVMVDEADSISIPSTAVPKCRCAWFITATYASIWKRRNMGWIRDVFRCEGEGKAGINSILVKCSDEYCKLSYKLPDPIMNFVRCSAPHIVSIIGRHVPQDIHEMLNAGAVDEAIRRLGGNVDTNRNIFSVVTKFHRTHISDGKARIRYLKSLKNMTEKDKEESIERCRVTIKRAETRIESIRKDIRDIENRTCSICLDNLRDPVLVPCCCNIYCSLCIIKWIESHTSNNTCPACRAPIDVSKLQKFKDKEDDDSESEEFGDTKIRIKKPNFKKPKSKVKARLKTKLIARTKPKPKHISKWVNNGEREIKTKDETILELIKDLVADKRKVIIFSGHTGSFDGVKRILNQHNISNAILHPSQQRSDSAITRFNEGKSVLLLNTQNCGAGIDLSKANDIVIYHELVRDTETQVIGRAQRIGREGQITVHLLHNDDEYTTRRLTSTSES